ncbi:hypothetical protein SCHPADRAFT_664727 [Schizopora paradoxa]|uniref:Uncharacterized protein n=1 Tax=Schizopora paradoxa TaxID=27342 RepID=A0A0H2R5M1_9AGAM|nr:hypothetical protein SCHPADRAFT_664727 [Schizopora paradoxa]
MFNGLGSTMRLPRHIAFSRTIIPKAVVSDAESPTIYLALVKSRITAKSDRVVTSMIDARNRPDDSDERSEHYGVPSQPSVARAITIYLKKFRSLGDLGPVRASARLSLKLGARQSDNQECNSGNKNECDTPNRECEFYNQYEEFPFYLSPTFGTIIGELSKDATTNATSTAWIQARIWPKKSKNIPF